MMHILYRKLWMQRSQIKIMLVMAGISLMMVFAFSGFNGVYVPTVQVVDKDQTELSAKYIDALNASKNQHYEIADETTAVRALRDGKVLAVVMLPEGFGKSLAGETSAELILRTTKADADTAVVEPYVKRTYDQIKTLHSTSDRLAKLAEQQGASYEKVYQESYKKLVEANRTKNAIEATYDTSSRGLIRNEVLLRGIMGFSLFFIAYSAVFGATDVLVERKHYTWQRLLVSPSSKLGMIAGNGLVSFSIGMMQVLLVFLAGRYLFGINYGAPIGQLILVGACFVVAMSGFGVFLSGVAKSMQQIGALTSVILTAFGMLGGCLWPLDLVTNKVLIFLSYLTPHRYAFEALNKINHGSGLNDIVTLLGILMLYGAIAASIGVIALMKKEEAYN